MTVSTRRFAVGALMMLGSATALAVTPVTYTTTYDAARYNGSNGSITFNDWGYTGPAGVGANDFQVGGGFNASRLGQKQDVTTLAPDLLTPDAPQTVSHDFTSSNYFKKANMDGQVSFFKWAYTTPTSHFYNMQIDKAGNYFVAKSDMQFGLFDVFKYTNMRTGAGAGIPPNEVYDTGINFYPWAMSNGKGWCGSVLNSNPNGVGVMAGQLTFDVAFDVSVTDGNLLPNGQRLVAPSNSQVIPGMVMRSYGTYSVNVYDRDGYLQTYSGSAVMNNTNPTISPLDANGEVINNSSNPALDANFQNHVSFLGGGVIPNGAWVYNEGTWDMTVAPDQSAQGTTQGQVRASDGAVWHDNSFKGKAFLMRADGQRTLTFIADDGHSDYVTTDAAAYASLAAVPVPAAVWLFGSGLLGVAGVARRKRANLKN